MLSAISILSHRCQYLPRSHWISTGTITLTKKPHTSGTRTQVYGGMQNDKYVAVKVLRTSNQEDLVELEKVSRGGLGDATQTCANLVRNSVFFARRSCGNTPRVHTSSSSMACFTLTTSRRSSPLGCITEISPNIWRNTPMCIGYDS